MLVLPAFVLLLGIVSADEYEVDDKMVVRAVVEVNTQHVAKKIPIEYSYLSCIRGQ